MPTSSPISPSSRAQVSVTNPPDHLRSQYDFQTDFPWAKKRERYAARTVVASAEAARDAGHDFLADHLAGDDGQARYEVKAERKAFKTGNLFIETSRVKRLGSNDRLEDQGDGTWLYTYTPRVKNEETGRWEYVRNEDGTHKVIEHLIAPGDERFAVKGGKLIEWSGIRASRAEFWNIVVGGNVLTVEREPLLAAARDIVRRLPGRFKEFSGDNGSTQGIVMTVAEVVMCNPRDLVPEDVDGVEFLDQPDAYLSLAA